MITPALTDRLWPYIKEEYFNLLDTSLSNNQLFDGVHVKTVEQEICKLTNRKHCIFTNSGTSAILMSLIALGIKPGDEVICSNLSHPASANQVSLLNATPVFVDVDQYGHLNPNQVENCVTSNTKAILPVGLYGENYDHSAIQIIANKYNLKILEDSAQSYATFYDQLPAGSLGDVSVLSFARNKPAMTPFGSGALVTDSEEIANRAKLIGTHGKLSRSTCITTLGINAQAKEDRAIATVIALRNIKKWNNKRSTIADYYKDACKVKGIKLRECRPQSTNNNHKFVMFLDNPQKTIDFFRKKHVQLVKYYQEGFEQSILGQQIKRMPASEKFIQYSVVLPTDPFITDNEIEHICNLILAI